MTSCELCGNQSNSLSSVRISGSKMNVCNNCSSYGKNVSDAPKSYDFYRKKNNYDSVEDLVSNYIELISLKMAKQNISAKQLSLATNIKESEMYQYLSKKIKPDNNIAKKIGNFLQIKLVDEIQGGENLINTINEDKLTSLTLGDLLKKQMEKNDK